MRALKGLNSPQFIQAIIAKKKKKNLKRYKSFIMIELVLLSAKTTWKLFNNGTLGPIWKSAQDRK